MNLKEIVIGFIAVIALVIGGMALTQQPSEIIERVGNASSPAVINGCMEIDGGTVCTHGVAMRSASTTCAFKSPAATSTLLAAVGTITKSYGGSFDVEWGIGATQYATTTSIGYLPAAIASGDTGTFTASTTFNGSDTIEDPAWVIAPNKWVNFKVGSTSPTLGGYCYAQFLTK